MPSTNYILQQPYKYSEATDKDQAKKENQNIREEIKKRRAANKPYDSLLNPNETRVYLFLIVNRDHKLKLKTDYKVLPKYWDFNKRRVKPSHINSVELNKGLLDLRNKVEDTYYRLMNNYPEISFKEVTRNIKAVLEEEHLPIKASKSKSFLEVFDEFIEVKSKERNKLTIKKYRTCRNSLVEFEAQTRYRVDFETLDLKFYDKYKDFLLNKPNPKNGSGLLNDTIAKYISTLKYFLKWAYDRKYHSNDVFKHEDFKATRKPKNEIVTLTEEEVNRIMALDLDENRRLDRVRDLFCFGIYTGQRWSDIERFSPNDVTEDTWRFECYKTKKLMEIPLTGFTQPAREVLNKYEGQLPSMSAQKFNDYLKEVGELAEINTEVEIKRYSGNQLVSIRKPKHEFMSSHMARRTCTTLLLEKGVPVTVVMRLTGHQDIKTLMKYDNTSQDALISELKRIG